CARDHVLWDVW
nr:immunoglobulin heavy chain junction region [Macaca mulatta]MOV48989.1 immunoglobulin heavy chain junction region [Macaca mulatta]MOV49209.1 immunoglobulin heavy chain junction region [Macaca mulatta]MOV50657.1 immunoglobulin heavy chain junction region [Macaca mulatta]MOV51250.1 immunoglobulin heavy chain junction region [Macaca mulatta]